MMNSLLSVKPFQKLLAWAVHAFTVTGACLGMLTLIKIYQHDYKAALWLMAATIIIDALDGTLARLVRVKMVLPTIDGALLDNLTDYLNYVITPCFFLFVKQDMLPHHLTLLVLISIIITSSYQFCQADAKTPDHFFKGFPCYWNIAVFYMFIFNTSMVFNSTILLIFCVLIFVPIKYVYPSRLDYLTESKALKLMMHGFSIVYGISSAIILWIYPEINTTCLVLSLAYITIYFVLSFYRTYSPMILSKMHAFKESK